MFVVEYFNIIMSFTFRYWWTVRKTSIRTDVVVMERSFALRSRIGDYS